MAVTEIQGNLTSIHIIAGTPFEFIMDVSAGRNGGKFNCKTKTASIGNTAVTHMRQIIDFIISHDYTEVLLHDVSPTGMHVAGIREVGSVEFVLIEEPIEELAKATPGSDDDANTHVHVDPAKGV